MALSANATRVSRNPGLKRRYPVTGSATIYAGSLCMLDAGFVEPAAAASVTTASCVGVAVEAVDNSAGGNGDRYVEVQEGEYLFAGTTLAAATATGQVLYAEDDDTVDETQTGSEPIAGVCTEFVSATSAWVRVGLLSNS